MANPDGPISFSSGFGNQLVTIEVGEEKQQFQVHRDILTASSTFFKAAFDGEFREAKEKLIHLTDTAPTTFRDFLAWLYSRRLGVPELDDEDELEENECFYCGFNCPGKSIDPEEVKKARGALAAYEGFPQLSRQEEDKIEAALKPERNRFPCLYVFADRYDVHALRKAIMDDTWYYYERLSSYPDWAFVLIASKNLPIRSPLCRYIVDQYVEHYDIEEEHARNCPIELGIRQKLPLEFVFTILNGLSVLKHHPKVSRSGRKPLCAYHEHPQDEASIQACAKARIENKKRKLDLLEEEYDIEVELAAEQKTKRT
ncbi:hypothetical protein FKW77_004376 [Venturia effusa]|uniref:BTB domain-containing protein n=1 Tax=Venturia effusa TaxID=50376 RepID=A0A517LLC5_9PEZI|nr:hypothetical protein FKW77_004376 [Venturia effusa]